MQDDVHWRLLHCQCDGLPLKDTWPERLSKYLHIWLLISWRVGGEDLGSILLLRKLMNDSPIPLELKKLNCAHAIVVNLVPKFALAPSSGFSKGGQVIFEISGRCA